MIILRDYQEKCVNAWFDALIYKSCTPLVAVPTGGGKSYIMCGLIGLYMDMFPNANILILSHTQEIIKQDYDSLLDFFPAGFTGLYSAGLGKKEVKKITVGGIQSVCRRPELFKDFDLIIVDECHTINHKGEGQYRKFFEKVKAKVTGMSATIFRTGHGYIHQGKGVLFDHLAYDLTSVEEFNKLVAEGYLTRLISVSTDMQLKIDGIKKQGGDYNQKQMSNKFDREAITKDAVEETIKYGKNYKKWLIFAIDIDHADNICSALRDLGIVTDVLHSRMSGDRNEVTRSFKSGSTRALVSVGMVTTGFDAPNVDMLVLLRPTMSAVLHVQMVGRGLRICEGKEHCLVLDFAGNTDRLGPINNVIVPNSKGSGGGGEAPTKHCPECSTINYAAARYCEVCNFEFEFKVKLTKKASMTEIVKEAPDDPKEKIKWLDVHSVQCTIHRKKGLPDSLLVLYRCGLTAIKEWVCFNHEGWAKRKADNWAKFRGYMGSLDTHSVFNSRQRLKNPKKIQVDFNDRYPNIIDVEFEE